MRKTYKNALMWALYGVLFLFMTVFQTVTFGRMRLFGVKLSLIPVTAACIAMHVGGESGAIFGLAAGLFWCLAGAAGGAIHIVLLALCGAVVGYVCDRYLRRNLLSALLMSLGCLIFCQGVLFLVQVFLGHVGFGAGLLPVLRQIGLSLLGGAAGVSGRLVDQKGRGINAAKNALPHDRVHLLHRGDDGGVRAAAL